MPTDGNFILKRASDAGEIFFKNPFFNRTTPGDCFYYKV